MDKRIIPLLTVSQTFISYFNTIVLFISISFVLYLKLCLFCVYVPLTVTEFPDEPDGIKVYKSLTSRSVPRVEFMSNVPTDSDMRVVFGTAIAYNGSQSLLLAWRLNGRVAGRLDAGATTAAVLPSFTDIDTSSVLTVRLGVSPTPDEQETELVATLTLLG